MSQNLIAYVCVAGVALLLDGVRVNFKPGETLPDALPLTVLDELVSLGAVEKRIAEPTSFVSEAAGSNEAGAAGGAIPGTHTPPVSEVSGAAAEVAAAPETEAAAEPSVPAAGKKKA